MKKILTFLMVFVALFTFVACDTGNSSSGNENGIVNPDSIAEEFKECATTVDPSELSITDGNWTVIGIQQYTGMLSSLTLQATVKDDYFTYTSGTQAGIGDASIMLEDEPEVLDALRNAKNDEEKTAIMIELQGEMPEGATLTWDGLIGTMTQPLDQEDLDDYSDMQFSLLSEDGTVIKTNADKTKYVISITFESDGSEVTLTYYLEKN